MWGAVGVCAREYVDPREPCANEQWQHEYTQFLSQSQILLRSFEARCTYSDCAILHHVRQRTANAVSYFFLACHLGDVVVIAT